MTYNNLTRLARKTKIVLGSASPRRFELLKETGIEFRRQISDFKEHNIDSGKPFELAQKLAEEKAYTVGYSIAENELVIGADTVVALNNASIGKPANRGDAARILKKLSGKKHTVCTALAFADRDELLASGFELTDVYFNLVSESQIVEYIRSGEPMDKAGAYGIQGMGGFLVDRIEGELDNVIGLPRRLLERLAGEVCDKIEKKNKGTR